MKRPQAWMIAAALLAGCKSPTAAIDPFFGRQTVAPPPTGLASANPPSSTYYNNAPTASVGANVPPAPATAANGPGSAHAPPGGFHYNNSAGGGPRTIPAAGPTSTRPLGTGSNPQGSLPRSNPNFGATNPGERSPASSGAGSRGDDSGASFQANTNSGGGEFRPPTTVASRTTNASNPGGARLPLTASPTRPSSSGAPPTNIDSLPDRGSRSLDNSNDSRIEPNTNNSSGFRPIGSNSNARSVSYEQPTDRGDANATKRPARLASLSTGSAKGTFAADPDYRWLKGKLEYSQTDDRWKLRYIPLDGETDNFGGSVTLLDASELQNLKAGEFVTAYGSLGETKSSGRDYAPVFKLDRVVRQTE